MVCDCDVDFVEPILKSGYTGRALLGFLSAEELGHNPYLTPASLDLPHVLTLYEGFSPTPTLLQEDAEQTLDPMRTFHYQLVADNDDSATRRFLVYPHSDHSFLVSSFSEPRHSQAFSEAGCWLLRVS